MSDLICAGTLGGSHLSSFMRSQHSCVHMVFDTSHANNVSLLSDTATCLCVFMVYLLVLIPADRNFVLFQAAVLSTECILVEL